MVLIPEQKAEITGVSALWPGWGHASESPELPDALNAKGIIFLATTALSMAARGIKLVHHILLRQLVCQPFPGVVPM